MTSKTRPLAELISAAGITAVTPVPHQPITQVTADSRSVRPGALFVAVRGNAADGHRFIPQALARGASAILTEESVELPPGVFPLKVDSTRRFLGPLAHAFEGSPSRSLKVLGVTGTKGKTTVTWWIHHLLEQANIPCGLIGTLCSRLGSEKRVSENTTPGAVSLQALLAEMVERHLKVCAMEVSSHALEQNRTDGIRFRCAIFTNLAPEHLDYHGDLEAYFLAKQRLFKGLDREAAAVLNQDDPRWESLRARTAARIVTYGLRGSADWSADRIRSSLRGISCRLLTPEGTFPARFSLVGRHNLENLLAALAGLSAAGFPAEAMLKGISTFEGVPGRLERIEAGQPFPVFVDYAHTEGALRRVLQELRAADPRRILTVFGCGGDRDRTKRPRMGRAAAELSDRVIVTSDNPRSEEPEAIAREITAGMTGSRAPWEICLDRREAIRRALESADSTWIVLIAGKGHETGQIFSDRTVPFDDRSVVREILGVKSNARTCGV